MSKTWMGVIVGVAALAVGVAGTYVYMQNKLNSETEKGDRCVSEDITSVSATATTSTSATAYETAGWKTYTSDTYGFSLQLPNNYSVQEEPVYEGAKGVTLRFGKEKGLGVAEYNFMSLTYLISDSNLTSLENSARGKYGPDLINNKSLKIDGQDANSYTLGGFASGKLILATNGSASFELHLYPDNDESSTLFNNVAETFRF